MKARVVLFGTSDFGIPSFEKMYQDARFDVVAVVTQPAKPTGRHQELTSTPVAKWAEQHQLLTLTPATLKSDAAMVELSKLKADLFLVASYGLILPPGVLAIPLFGCFNIHASLLPKYRGASPIAAAILNGDTETGITFMSMDAGCDTGPILRQIRCSIAADDTRPTLEQRLSVLSADAICQTVDDWYQKVILPKNQPLSGVTMASRLTRQDGKAVWSDAHQLERQIRAFQPWPGLWTSWKSTELKILSAVTINREPSEPAGTVVVFPDGWCIACQSGYLQPKLVQFAGKKPQPAINIPGSYPDFVGSELG